MGYSLYVPVPFTSVQSIAGLIRRMRTVRFDRKVRMTDFHGIVINVSQRDQVIFRSLKIIGRKRIFAGLITLLKKVPDDALESTIVALQANLREHFLWRPFQFCFHLYCDEQLIVVFKQRVFRCTTDWSTWDEVIHYGCCSGLREGNWISRPVGLRTRRTDRMSTITSWKCAAHAVVGYL